MSFQYRLENIILQDGSVIQPTDLTLIVGANNSGKSRLMKDILDLCTRPSPRPVIVAGVNHTRPNSYHDIEEAYQIRLHHDEHGNTSLRGLSPDLNKAAQVAFHSSHNLEANVNEQLRSWDQPQAARSFAEWFGHYFITFLGTEQRLLIVKEGPSGNVSESVETLLQALYKQGRPAATALSEFVHRSFGLHAKLDITALSSMVIRIGESFATVPDDAMDARPHMEKFAKLDDQGDGLRSFVATVLALLVQTRPVLLLDEPEAFLHPPQAMQLGEIVAETASSNRQLLIATHSTDFVRGVLHRTQNVTVIRMSRTGSTSQAAVLDPNEVLQLANNPLIGSSRALDGLFYSGAVAVEADGDSAFYQRVSRATHFRDEVHYVQVNGKHAMAKLIGPFRRLGIKIAAIVDFDVLRTRPEFTALLKAISPDPVEEILALQEVIRSEVEGKPIKLQLEELHGELIALCASFQLPASSEEEGPTLDIIRRALSRLHKQTDRWSECKENGRKALSDRAQKAFDKLSTVCKAHGLFIVPVGELESWMREYGIAPTNNKPLWIAQALDRLGQVQLTPDAELSQFITQVHTYLRS